MVECLYILWNVTRKEELVENFFAYRCIEGITQDNNTVNICCFEMTCLRNKDKLTEHEKTLHNMTHTAFLHCFQISVDLDAYFLV